MSGILQAIMEEKLPNSEEVVKKIVGLYDVDLQAKNYRVLLTTNAEELSDYEHYRVNCIDLPRRCACFFQKRGIRAAVESDHSGICIILLMDMPSRKLVDKIGKELVADLEKHQLGGVRVAAGNCVDKLSQIAHSYRMATAALSYRSLYSGERCLFAEDMQMLMNITTLQSSVKLDQMLQAFREGDLEKLRILVTARAEKVRAISGNSIDGRHPTSIRRMFVELTVYVLHIASDIGVDVDSILKGLDPYNFLLASDKDTPRIINWFICMCSDLRDAINEKAKNKENSIIRQACDYIDRHIAECDLSLDQVATAVNMTASYLSKLFHSKMGIGFSKFVVQSRMKIACSLLTETKLTVKEISERAGFASANYFGTVFKKEYSVSPHAYRQRYAKNRGEDKKV